MNLIISNRAKRFFFATLLLYTSMFTGCLALSFGGKTENNHTMETDRITRLEQRIQNVEKYVGIQPPTENVQYAATPNTSQY